MIKKNLVAQLVLLCLVSCSSNEKSNSESTDNSALVSRIDQLNKENEELKATVKQLRYPVSDRLINISRLISENKLNEANMEIINLEQLFPQSIENEEVVSLKQKITNIEEEQRAEEVRIKALGFKALKEENSVEIGYNKISIGAFATANTYVFDSYGDRYFYRTADRDSKYVSAKVSITSSDKNPKLPMFYSYLINGDKLELIKIFSLNFAKWDDYGSYLGNYHDNGNDFAKTSTVGFKIGVEINSELLQKPIVILLLKENCAERVTERFANPPVSYTPMNCDSPSTLSMEDVNKNYAVVKILNKNKI